MFYPVSNWTGANQFTHAAIIFEVALAVYMRDGIEGMHRSPHHDSNQTNANGMVTGATDIRCLCGSPV
jgi:hypothetical protein